MKDDKNQSVEHVELEVTDETKPFDQQSTLKAQSPEPQEDYSLDGAQNTTFSAVAQGAGSKKIFIAAAVIAGSFGLYYVISTAQKEAAPVKNPTQELAERSKNDAEKVIKESKPLGQGEQINTTQQTPKLPSPPPLVTPKPPEPAPPPVPTAPQAPLFPTSGSASTAPAFTPSTVTPASPFTSREDDLAKKKALAERRKSSIMVLGGKDDSESTPGSAPKTDSSTKKDGDKATTAAKDKSSFLGFGEGAFGESTIAKTSSDQVKATQIGRLDSMIAQGKIINAILETAVNTDLPGSLRAVITRDVYAESGNRVLIPKGSRVIGSYQSQVKGGQTRVAVAWDRLIRPDGVDLALGSPGTDSLGRTGVPGYLDNKFLTRMGNAFLVSYLVPILTNEVFKVNKNSSTTNTSTTNPQTGATTTSTTSTIRDQQAQQSAEKFNQIFQKTIEEAFPTTPTIYIDQGTQVNIFVNKDLVFPASSVYGNAVLR